MNQELAGRLVAGWLLVLGVVVLGVPASAQASPGQGGSELAVGGSCVSPAPHGFSDVPIGSYADVAVGWLLEAGITSGTAPGKFSPSQSVTRGQMAVFLWRAAGAPAGVGTHGFTDVTPGAYYEAAVTWLVGEGITAGTSAGKYSPSQSVPRGQMAVFLYRDGCGSPATVSLYGPDAQQTITVLQEGGPVNRPGFLGGS